MFMSHRKFLKLSSARDMSLPKRRIFLSRVSSLQTKEFRLSDPRAVFPLYRFSVRPETQVELSASDARSIGVNAPCRESGDIAGSGACKLVGPAGEVELSEGVIVAKRHIHATPEDAEKFGLKDKEIVSVKINSNGRSLVFGDVVVRVSPKYALAMHIDTDESNAAFATPGMMGEIIK